MDDWLLEYLEHYDRLTPIQRLEFQEEIDRMTENGEMIVIHGYKSKGKSQYAQWIIDRWPDKEGDTNDTNPTV